MNEELELFLKKFKIELYQFAYALLPDDLQATQVVVDSVALVLSDFIDFHIVSNEQLKVSLLEGAFQISKKRVGHNSLVENDSAYYLLPFEDRAVLFLHFRLSLDFATISLIVGRKEAEITALIARSKKQLLSKEFVS